MDYDERMALYLKLKAEAEQALSEESRKQLQLFNKLFNKLCDNISECLNDIRKICGG